MLASSLRWSHRVLSTCSSTMSCSLMQARTFATSPPDDVPGSPHEADKFRFKKRTIFPMCLPTNDQKASDPSVLFNAFRAETLHQMKDRFELNDHRELSVDEQGFYLTDYPMRLAWLSTSFFTNFVDGVKRRLNLMKVTQSDPKYDWQTILHAAPLIMQRIALHVATVDFDDLYGRLDLHLLQQLKERSETLTRSQREVLHLDMDDFVLNSPMILQIDRRVEGRQVFADFLCYDVAVYQVHKLEFDFKRQKGLKMHDYPYPFPRQIIFNIVFTRQLEPTLGEEFVVTQFNLVVTP